MKRILRLDEHDIQELVATVYDVPTSNVATILTEEPQGYDEEMTPIFYVEVELKEMNSEKRLHKDEINYLI